MDKEARYDLYKGAVLPGWWPILDKYLPQLMALDPDCDISIKEKFGVLRIGVFSSKIEIEKQIEIEHAAELTSSTVCEYCGAPGRLRANRSWRQTLCDRCNHLNRHTIGGVIQDAEQRWLKTTDDAWIRACGSAVIDKHIEAMKELAKGE